MPKEQINYPRTEKIYVDSSIDSPREEDAVAHVDPALIVHWNPAGDDRSGLVQVSTVKYDQVKWSEYDEAPAWPREPSAELFSPPLSRSEINAMIRVLRRARDQAYGRDE